MIFFLPLYYFFFLLLILTDSNSNSKNIFSLVSLLKLNNRHSKSITKISNFTVVKKTKKEVTQFEPDKEMLKAFNSSIYIHN